MNPLIALFTVGPLAGYRTYIIGALMVVNGLYAYFTGEPVPTFDGPGLGGGVVSDTEALRMVLEGLGLNTLRAGVGSATK